MTKKTTTTKKTKTARERLPDTLPRNEPAFGQVGTELVFAEVKFTTRHLDAIQAFCRNEGIPQPIYTTGNGKDWTILRFRSRASALSVFRALDAEEIKIGKRAIVHDFAGANFCSDDYDLSVKEA